MTESPSDSVSPDFQPFGALKRLQQRKLALGPLPRWHMGLTDRVTVQISVPRKEAENRRAYVLEQG